MRRITIKTSEKEEGGKKGQQIWNGKERERENIYSELCNEFMPGWQIFISYWKNSRGSVLTQLGLRSIN